MFFVVPNACMTSLMKDENEEEWWSNHKWMGKDDPIDNNPTKNRFDNNKTFNWYNPIYNTDREITTIMSCVLCDNIKRRRK